MEEKYYKIYVPIDVTYRKQLRMQAARNDKSTPIFAAAVLQEYIENHKLPEDPELPMFGHAS